jgi:hypothetical protein
VIPRPFFVTELEEQFEYTARCPFSKSDVGGNPGLRRQAWAAVPHPGGASGWEGAATRGEARSKSTLVHLFVIMSITILYRIIK